MHGVNRCKGCRDEALGRYLGEKCNDAGAAPDTNPINFHLFRGTEAIWADACVGSSLCRPATRRPRPLARPRRAEQVPSGLPDGCDPAAGCSAGSDRVLIRAYTVASPEGPLLRVPAQGPNRP